MVLTSKAKSRFEESDLLRRGRQLIQENIQYGVTAMRAFVEVDGEVKSKCLESGLKLRQEFEDKCEIQICAFAQLPLLSGGDGGDEIRKLITGAARREGVDVDGKIERQSTSCRTLAVLYGFGRSKSPDRVHVLCRTPLSVTLANLSSGTRALYQNAVKSTLSYSLFVRTPHYSTHGILSLPSPVTWEPNADHPY